MTCRPIGVVLALVLSSGALRAQQPPAPAVQQPAAAPVDLLSGNGVIDLTLEAPLQQLFAKGSEDEKFSVPGRVSYKDPSSGVDVQREAQVSVRGHTSRRETECSFPKLKLTFKEGDELKIGTHCGESADDALSPKYGRLANEKAPHREALVYRLLQAAEVPTLRARPATVTYLDKGQAPLKRKALLVEDDGDAKKRLQGIAEIPMEQFGDAKARGALADAGRIAFGQAMIGNFDWHLKNFPEDEYRGNVRKPIWNILAFDRGEGKAALLAKDFDLAGIVVGRHSWFKTIFNPAYVPSKSEIEIEVLSQVQRTRSLYPRSELDALRRHFVDRKAAIYGVLEQAAEVDPKGREIARSYLDNFFKAITDDESFYRPVVAKEDVRVYVDAARTREACKPNDLVRPGTPVNELQRSGSMSQVVILDARWRWTSDERCQAVQNGPVWVPSDSITKDYPARN
jgi:hypothetical protein